MYQLNVVLVLVFQYLETVFNINYLLQWIIIIGIKIVHAI